MDEIDEVLDDRASAFVAKIDPRPRLGSTRRSRSSSTRQTCTCSTFIAVGRSADLDRAVATTSRTPGRSERVVGMRWEQEVADAPGGPAQSRTYAESHLPRWLCASTKGNRAQ